MSKAKKALIAAMLVGGLLVGGLAVWWVDAPPGSSLLPFRDPDKYMGRIPPLTRLETYQRLVPWRLAASAAVDATVLMVNAESYACNLSKERPFGQMQETFERVEVYETADTVTLETWLGPPEGDGFWPGCKGTGTGFPVRVELDSPLGNRQIVDPGCDLDRHADLSVCENPAVKFEELRFGTRPTAAASPRRPPHGALARNSLSQPEHHKRRSDDDAETANT